MKLKYREFTYLENDDPKFRTQQTSPRPHIFYAYAVTPVQIGVL